MSFVLDSSFAVTWVLKDEATPATDKALDSLGQGAKAFVPALWWWEVGNVFLSVERAKRATKPEISAHMLLFRSLPIEVDEVALSQAWGATHLLAQKYSLTSYDAAYLELAIRHGLPLASLDEDLRDAARAEKVALLAEK
jgi:predicted nucleic acid-binding protein